MKPVRPFILLLMYIATAAAQTAPPSPLLKPDDRLKADVLLIVAHPDDETGVAAYLAQLEDEHKRVAVVYMTHGEAGHNSMGPERAASLGAVREMELRHAQTALGIHNVWFLDGRDTPSQNVLQSLANWRHGLALEEVVRMVRLTRPEVILTWLPGFFIGENHGDHQASGVVATEAFDLAGDPAAFPAQLAGATRANETWLDGLQPWQPKKIYYFSDASDNSRFHNAGPSYANTAISPSRKLPYWRIAMDVFRFHLSQYRGYIERLGKLDDQQLAAELKGWGESTQLTFGKSNVAGSMTGDVFEGVTSGRIPFAGIAREPYEQPPALSVELGGPWGFYEKFRREHGLKNLPVASIPEISIKRGATLQIPLELRNDAKSAQSVSISLKLPEGWTTESGAGTYSLDAQNSYHAQVTLTAPKAETTTMQEIQCQAESGGRTIGVIKLNVRLAGGGLPQ